MLTKHTTRMIGWNPKSHLKEYEACTTQGKLSDPIIALIYSHVSNLVLEFFLGPQVTLTLTLVS